MRRCCDVDWHRTRMKLWRFRVCTTSKEDNHDKRTILTLSFLSHFISFILRCYSRLCLLDSICVHYLCTLLHASRWIFALKWILAHCVIECLVILSMFLMRTSNNLKLTCVRSEGLNEMKGTTLQDCALCTFEHATQKQECNPKARIDITQNTGMHTANHSTGAQHPQRKSIIFKTCHKHTEFSNSKPRPGLPKAWMNWNELGSYFEYPERPNRRSCGIGTQMQ